MYRKRLRPAYLSDELRDLYPSPYHTGLAAQRMRIDLTLSVAKWMAEGVWSVADLSCGANEIVSALDVRHKWVGDFAPGYPIQGPIEETLDQIPHVDLFILSETIEHLDKPDEFLERLREKTTALLLTTPIAEGRDEESYNPEHYWGWDQQGVSAMLQNAGFTEVRMRMDTLTEVPGHMLPTQLWGVQ
jgi:hypothetical protein